MNIHILWALVIGFSTVMYTIFDGFDLGVGVLLPFIRKEEQRDMMVDSITPVWDGNETWIALIGVGMFGGFSKAYSILLPALYLPLILMIISLVLRGVAMEFRYQSIRHRTRWDSAFAAGSVLAAFCQGIVLGNLMEGIEVHAGVGFRDTSFHFFSPFTMLTGVTLVVAYAVTGAAWLNYKTTGVLQATIKRYARVSAALLAGLFFLIIYGRFHWTIFAPRFGVFGIDKILSVPSIVWYVVAAGLLSAMLWGVGQKKDWLPLALQMVLVAISAAYLVSGFWPYIVPPQLTIADAASPASGSSILLYAGFIVIPVILGYLLYSYFVFRGKVTGKDNYEPPPVADVEWPGVNAVKGSINLAWPWRLLIAVSGLVYFFVVLGFLGDAFAVASIVLLIIFFLLAVLLWKR